MQQLCTIRVFPSLRIVSSSSSVILVFMMVFSTFFSISAGKLMHRIHFVEAWKQIIMIIVHYYSLAESGVSELPFLDLGDESRVSGAGKFFGVDDDTVKLN